MTMTFAAPTLPRPWPPQKPLHVLVAEAIGYRWLVRAHADPSLYPRARFLASPRDAERLIAMRHSRPASGDEPPAYGLDEKALGMRLPRVPRFDIDWSATGPLVERLHIGLRCLDPRESRDLPPAGYWCAEWPFEFVMAYSYAATPLIAACEAIVAMAAQDPEAWRALLAGRHGR
ncbi:MAG TPA: hypothetical protein VGL15_13610 [Vicinamibacteria bacterium]